MWKHMALTRAMSHGGNRCYLTRKSIMERVVNCSMVDAPACCSGRVEANMRSHRRDHFQWTARLNIIPVPWHIIRFSDRRGSKLMLRASAESKTNGVHPKQNEGSLEKNNLIWTKFVAETLLPTTYGKLRLRGYRHTTDGGLTFTEPSAIISGRVENQQEVVVRVHDACFTSEVLGSLKCDCREQLQLALESIQDSPPGMVIYLQQEGRGIGLANKIAAYALQEKGLDTVDANRALGLPDDCREYSAVAHVLKDLGITSIRLMTNNPRKINELTALGINVTGRVPCQVKAGAYNIGYLGTKQRRMQHLMEPEEGMHGQYCFWDHDGEPSSAGIPLQPTIVVESGVKGSSPVPRLRMDSTNKGIKGGKAKVTDFECGGLAGQDNVI